MSKVINKARVTVAKADASNQESPCGGPPSENRVGVYEIKERKFGEREEGKHDRIY